MVKYVTDEFRDALIKRAYQFCYGENDCSINPEIALAYLDAAEVLGADPNKGNITINDIRKEAKTKLSSVEDKMHSGRMNPRTKDLPINLEA